MSAHPHWQKNRAQDGDGRWALPWSREGKESGSGGGFDVLDDDALGSHVSTPRIRKESFGLDCRFAACEAGPLMTTTHPLSPLLEKMPGRPRVLVEVLYVLALVYSPGVVGGGALLVGASAALALLGVALVRPWRTPRRSGGLAAAGLLLVGCAAMVALARQTGPSARLGIVPDEVAAVAAGGRVKVGAVVGGSPAQGRLLVGDVIGTLDGQPLARTFAAADLARRIVLAAPGEHVLGVSRGGVREEIKVMLPPLPFGLGPVGWTGVRDLALLLVLAALLWSDGQGASQLGLTRQGLGRDLARGGLVLLGALAFQVAVSVPLGAIVRLAGVGNEQFTRRASLYAALGHASPWWVLALAIVTAAAFEEIFFRAYLLPRVRVVTGHWGLALVVVAMAFGVGHLYAGSIAVVQATALGLFFGVAYLWRGRLVPVVVAHACFDGLMFAVTILVQHSAAFHRLATLH